MRLAPRELESLHLHQAGFLAQKRLARGLRLNHPEAVALIASQVQELVRDGYTVADLMDKGRHMLGRRQVLPGVEEMISEIQVEATFPDGTKLVTVHSPISREDGDLSLALYGSFLPEPDLEVFGDEQKTQSCIPVIADESVIDQPPGKIFPQNSESLELNAGRKTRLLRVTSLCDRPIQVGSHYHFIETNKSLVFDRSKSYGMRLHIPAGTAIRFEPGETKDIPLVEIAGRRVVRGGNGLCDGPVDPVRLPDILKRVKMLGFGHQDQNEDITGPKCTLPRSQYARIYGPTVGDKVRLGDTSLVIEVEKDHTVYGDECKFGGGKVLREGMGQACLVSSETSLDTVITNVLIVDAVTGIIKADVGIKNGLIAGIGKAGNPDVMESVMLNMVVGVGTEAIAGEGLILTAGALDSHVHFICPQLVREAIAAGITTMFGGGTGPASGTCATTCTPGPNHIRVKELKLLDCLSNSHALLIVNEMQVVQGLMIQSTDDFPLNFGFTGKGNTSRSEGISVELVEQIEAGAIGLKLHEDWGSTPSAVDHCLRVAEECDVQIMIHTDTLNESSCVEQTIEAFKGRTIHTYHSEGAGGGHAPDILRVCGESNVLPSSTNPTRPFTRNTIDEHMDMLMVCHHLDKNLKEDVAFAESRIRAETIAAEDILHDIGAISMISSDSQAMGRIGEIITRTWQTADKMKCQRGRLPEEKGSNDNFRVKRYIAKYTINPAIAHGMSELIGSVQKGKLADLVLWKPAFFGAKPEIIIKGGQIAWAQMGMPNASIPTPQPVKQRKMFGAYGNSVASNSVVFVSKLSVENGIVQNYGVRKKPVPVTGCRQLTKKDMILNDYLPRITVDPYSYQVHIIEDRNGKEHVELLTCNPADKLALAQLYYLF